MKHEDERAAGTICVRNIERLSHLSACTTLNNETIQENIAATAQATTAQLPSNFLQLAYNPVLHHAGHGAVQVAELLDGIISPRSHNV